MQLAATLPFPCWATLRYQERGVALQLVATDAMGEDDAATLERIAQGDARAYRALSERHLGPILRYATRLLGDQTEAEDVAQETFLRLWQRAGAWEPRAKLSTWLHRIAHNLCVDRLRQRRGEDPAALERESTGDRPSGLLRRKQVSAEVQAALNELPERQRAAVVLTHYQGMSNPEAAEVLEIGVDALESLLARGRRTLREQLAHLQTESEEGSP